MRRFLSLLIRHYHRPDTTWAEMLFTRHIHRKNACHAGKEWSTTAIFVSPPHWIRASNIKTSVTQISWTALLLYARLSSAVMVGSPLKSLQKWNNRGLNKSYHF